MTTQHLYPSLRHKVVTIGGGTGTHTVLTGLKQYYKEVDITAIVTMADSGGSTGRLRDEFGYLPVGDVRMALAALAGNGDAHENLLRQLFLYRFDKGEGLRGHNIGNLLLVALREILGSDTKAILAASRVLRVCGRVLPVTNEPIHLVATYADGRVVQGEHKIDEVPIQTIEPKIVDLKCEPSMAVISDEARHAIEEADLIVLGPGDLYTSLLANCVVPKVAETLQSTSAKIIYICNLMTKYGNTTGMGVSEHVAEISRYVGREPDIIMFNTQALPDSLINRYAKQQEYPVKFNYDGDPEKIMPLPLVADVLPDQSESDTVRRSYIRHDAYKLASYIMKYLRHHKR